MAETQAATGLVPQHWNDKFFVEYTRANKFSRYMGTSPGAMIQVNEELGRKAGDKITFATVRRLKQEGVTGDAVLEGNEEEVDSRSMALQVDFLRHAVVVTKKQEQLSAIALADAGRAELQQWAKEKMKRDLIRGFSSIDGKLYADATPTERNTWMVNNADRVLFGSAVANAVSGVMATALATIDNTDDKLTPSVISLAKRRAQLADPPIRPIQVRKADQEEEWFVLFAPSLAFRDLSQNADMRQANRDARERGMDNPIWTGGDLIWDGVIVKEFPDMPVLAGVGNGIDVAPCFFCGAQALGVAWAQRTQTVVEKRDYRFRHGIAIEEMRGIGKLRFGTGTASDTATPKDAGMLSLFVAAVPDA